MKYWFRAHARPNLDEKVTDKHARLLRGLKRIKGDWGLQGRRAPRAREPGPRDEFGIWVKLKGFLGPGIRGDIFYASRSYLAWELKEFGPARYEERSDDDYITLEFDPHKVDFAALADGVFAEYVAAFEAYLGEVHNQEFNYIDHVNGGESVSSRYGVAHLSHLNYFDRVVCRRAFGLTPAQVVKRAKPHLHAARVERGGALLITAREAPTFTQSWETHARVMPLLTGKPVRTTRQVKLKIKELAELEAARTTTTPARIQAHSQRVKNIARTALCRTVRTALSFLRSAARNEDVKPAAVERGLSAIAAELAGCSPATRKAILGKSAKSSRRSAQTDGASDDLRLARAAIVALQFLDLAPDRDVQLDTAVSGMEVISAELTSVTALERAKLVAALEQLTAEEKSGSRRKKMLEFYDEFLDAFGLSEVD